MEHLTPESVQSLAARVKVPLDDADVEAVTPLLGGLLGAIERCDELPTDPETLDRIAAAAVETSTSRSWARLVERLR